MKELLTALLVLPFLLGTSGSTAVPVPTAAEAHSAAPGEAGAHALSASSHAAPQPSLPVQLSSAGVAAGAAPFDGTDTGRWRTRSNGHDPLHLQRQPSGAALRTTLLRLGRPDFRQALVRVRLGHPSTFSKPPPPRLT